MSAFSDFVAKHDDLINKVNEAIMYSKFHAVQKVYIDLPLLKDTRLGLILATDKEALPYVIANLKQYMLKPNRSFTFAFPKLKYKEKDYKQMYTDPKYGEDLFNHSPDTSLSGSLPAILRILRMNNNRVKATEKIHVTVNIFPLQTNKLMEAYRNILLSQVENIATIDFIRKDPREISENEWKTTDVLFLDDISYELDPKGRIYKPLFQDMSMSLAQIYAPYCCDDSILHQWQRYNVNFADKETVDLIFKTTEIALNTVCHFLFASFDVSTGSNK